MCHQLPSVPKKLTSFLSLSFYCLYIKDGSTQEIRGNPGVMGHMGPEAVLLPNAVYAFPDPSF